MAPTHGRVFGTILSSSVKQRVDIWGGVQRGQSQSTTPFPFKAEKLLMVGISKPALHHAQGGAYRILAILALKTRETKFKLGCGIPSGGV